VEWKASWRDSFAGAPKHPDHKPVQII